MELEPKLESIEYLQANGLCNKDGYHPSTFYPENEAGVRRAKSVCRQCVIVDQCLDYAIENHERFGVWGGTSERERRKIARLRRAA